MGVVNTTQGLLSSVSSHSFSRRTKPGRAKKSSSEVDTKGWFLEKQHTGVGS
ncbi:unnamed protein product [Ectocarpus sp. 4 AP-2014]